MPETVQQTAISETIAVPRQVLAMIADYGTGTLPPQNAWKSTWFLLEPLCREALRIGTTRRAAPRIGPTMRATPTGARAPRGSRRQDIITALSGAANGMTRGELLEHFGLKGDKSGAMSISNALTNLTKGNQISREGGRYYAVASATGGNGAALLTKGLTNDVFRSHIPEDGAGITRGALIAALSKTYTPGLIENRLRLVTGEKGPILEQDGRLFWKAASQSGTNTGSTATKTQEARAPVPA